MNSLSDEQDNGDSAQVRKFFAIMSKSTRKDLAKMNQVLMTFLDDLPAANVEGKVDPAPAQERSRAMTGTH